MLNSHGADLKNNETERSQNRMEERSSEGKKRLRRTANEIARHYICKVDNCGKSYGSEGSLNQHIKLKHETYYAKQMAIYNLTFQS